MKISQNVEWIKPFIDSVADLIPIHKLTAIRGYGIRRGSSEIRFGSIILDSRNKYRINLKIWDKKNKNDKPRRCRYEMVLQTLAHELAHMSHWDHTPDHFWLQSKISLRFAHVLNTEGIEDHSDMIPKS